MSETEDYPNLVENNDFQKQSLDENKEKINPVENTDTYAGSLEETAKDQVEKEKEEPEKKESGTSDFNENARETPEEKILKSASTTNPRGTPTTDEPEGRFESNEREKETAGVGARGSSNDRDGRGNEIVAVGEWNSLPVLVERLRAALELSLATGSRRDDEPPALPEDSGIDSEEDFRTRNSMEQAVFSGHEDELKKDLKFLEDLLLSDIQTALSRLRETLERIDVTALTKHGAVSDPSSKLHLLRLVSSLLSRLQVSEKPVPETKPVTTVVTPTFNRRRRGTRHTIGVSAEELARARKWLQEEGSSALVNELPSPGKQQKEESSFFSPTSNGISTGADKRSEEIHDKCTKDAINQRQSLRDKNKETHDDNCTYQEISPEIVRVEIEGAHSKEDSSMYQSPYRPDVNSYEDKQRNVESIENVENVAVDESEERGRVGRLAAVLKQRAELSASSGKYGSSNKFMAKKSKIKRANTIDIPSYLKLQAESLGNESTGCVSLRRPINVSDKPGLNAPNVIVPSFQPKTENDRKFLALISKNNDAPTSHLPPPFKTFAYTKTTDLSSLTNEHWNSRFSNIKTTFDKPSANEERENKPFSKARKWIPTAPQTSHAYNQASERKISEDRTSSNVPVMKVDPGSAGFRHAPSSPFRRIEKPPAAVSPTKVPSTYHWSKSNAPPPTNTLREKARMLFDRENVQPQSSMKSRIDADSYEKSSFPRPPWIDHDGKSNGTVTENGRIDYRSFCKQFAPFVGKGTHVEPRGNSEFGESCQRSNVPSEKNVGVVDGKFSFKMIPEKRAQIHHYPPVGPRREVKQVPREKFGVLDIKNTYQSIKSGADRGYSDSKLPKANVFPDATLRGSSSVAVQTGMDEEHLDEGRSFRVAPKISKGPPSICSNAAVQTCSNDLEGSNVSVSDVEMEKQWKSTCYDPSDSNCISDSIQRSDNLRRFVLDHNQNYHAISSDLNITSNPMLPNPQDSCHVQKDQSVSPNATDTENIQPITNYPQSRQSEHPSGKDQRIEIETDERFSGKDHENVQKDNSSSFIPLNLSDRSQTEIITPYKNSSFLDDENIQNQDISPDTGVVTRYTCAIATVASINSPEPHSEEIGTMDSRTSSSPSPSQSWSCPRSRPPTNEHTTPEDEIRRHNMLQQSLVRKLQNERTSLNEPPSTNSSHYIQSPSYSQSVSNYNQSSTFIPSTYYNQAKVNQPSNFNEISSYGRSSNFLSPDIRRRVEPSPTTSTSTGPVTVNRVIALREAYEQVPSTQAKSIQKERSPIPNGINPIDSSDEYLVSCANKPSRSIVLSKSESWHQLALSNSYPRAPRINVTTASSSGASCLPKPPKPRSPSSQKLRSKQFEASSSADSVKKMEDKIRRYFDSPSDGLNSESKDRSRRSSPRGANKGLIGLSRSRTMPGICDEKLRLVIPAAPQIPLLNVNTADVDKVFDDLFEEATRTDHHC